MKRSRKPCRKAIAPKTPGHSGHHVRLLGVATQKRRQRTTAQLTMTHAKRPAKREGDLGAQLLREMSGLSD